MARKFALASCYCPDLDVDVCAFPWTSPRHYLGTRKRGFAIASALFVEETEVADSIIEAGASWREAPESDVMPFQCRLDVSFSSLAQTIDQTLSLRLGWLEPLLSLSYSI